MASPETADRAALPFPSVAWFQRLAELMNGNRARQEQLGYVDCVAQFTVVDGPDQAPWHVQVTFELFSVVDVRQPGPGDAARADFALEASRAVWRRMIESIAAGRGRPGLEHTLNHLSNMGAPIAVRAGDPLRRDLYFRYNQSLQEFVNASGSFATCFQ
ncbi:MAG: hypothetical protein ACREJT_01280 [Myxococcota bacterium]